MRTLSRFEPFRGASTLQDHLNRVFNEVFERTGDESNLTSCAAGDGRGSRREVSGPDREG
jgi:hypothetical protein